MMAKKLAVIRSFGINDAEIEFFKNFADLELKFIGPNICPGSESSHVQYVTPQLIFPLKIDPVSILRSGKFSVGSWVYMKNLDRCLSTVDFVNIPDTWFFFSRQAAVISKRLNRPLITTVWETIPHHYSSYLPPYAWNARIVVKNTDLFIAVTKKAKAHLESLHISASKIKIVYPGVDLSKFYPRNKPVNEGPTKVLFVGRLINEKGVAELLKAFAFLCQELQDKVELWIVGRGYLESLVNGYASKYPIEYLGFVNHEKLPEIYRKCDIFCLPSKDRVKCGIKLWEEQLGFALLEAMASGLPIVSTDCGCIPEIVGSDNLIIPSSAPDKLVAGLLDLLVNKEKCHEIGRNNRKRAERHFDAKKQAKILEKEILSKPFSSLSLSRFNPL
ncbi:glycosyltransferase family 4 protein [Candidatus Aerophobetes bacterium]|nr:glycosyltransferase family 4 protein [Candidatus Aerophobetes bacterium]